ncbi:LssY C-terminal domain-containing protein [Brachybacterium sp. AOP25-B2-12]|uniref:LssY C-terminal domain-containing protein n=1 Tax=Brachybacterium sp. AOP25-B2-12 TaxID=3457710 RepID=UPI0040347E6D
MTADAPRRVTPPLPEAGSSAVALPRAPEHGPGNGPTAPGLAQLDREVGGRGVRPLDRPAPTSPPEYDHPDHPHHGGRRIHLYPLLDALFVIVGTGLSLWLGALYLREGFSLSPTKMLYLLAFWLLFTYVALPRLHQLLTVLYLPDYFIGRTRTSEGVLSDPLNLALDGDETDLHTAMRRAGWALAEERTVESAWRMVVATVLRRSYAQAPMSDLYLMGRRHDFAYQQEVGGTTAKRHHVRFWRLPEDFVLPGGYRAQWLAAGTYDRAVGFSMFTLQITHKIDEDIDVERDYIIDTLRYADPEIPVVVIEEFSTAYHHRNGQGDRVRTDGDLPVVDLTGARERSDGATAIMLPRHRPTGISVMRSRAEGHRGAVRQLRSVARPSSRGSGAHRAELADQFQHVVGDIQDAFDNASEHHLPPPTIVFTGVLVVLQAVLVAVQWIDRGLGRNPGTVVADAIVIVPAETELWRPTAVAAIGLVLMVLVLRRMRWARLVLMGLLTADAVVRLVGATALLHGSGEHAALTLAGASMLGLMAITSDAARMWVLTPREPSERHGVAEPADLATGATA